MKKRILSMLLAALLCLALLPAGLMPATALAAEGQDYTSVEVTEESFEKIFNLAYGLYMENSQPGTGGGFTWDSEGKKRSWTYYNGIMMDAFLMLDGANFESYVNTFYNKNVTSQGQVNSSGAADNYYRENELDSIPPTRALFDLLRSNSVSEADKSKYKRMIDYVYFVMSRFEVIPGTNDNFRYKMNNANWETYQLALDGMYMAQPFFMEIANALDDGTLTVGDFQSYTGSDENLEDTDKIYSAVFDRMYWVGDNLYDDDGNGLYNHAWGPVAGLNGQYWLRAVGWYAAALADVISMLPDNFAEERIMLIEIETRLFDGMIAHQDRDTGMWYNVINYGPELAGSMSMNQLESSGSALMAYAMMRSYAEGYVDRSYGAAGLRAFNGTVTQKLDGEDLHDVYLSSGVETYPEGYLTKPYVTNEAKGVGPLLMAAAWARQAAELYNQPVAVPLCALDGDTNEALPGVTAQVLGPDGSVAAEWNSTEPLPVEGILPGVEYTIHVISAPAGYALPEDVAFSLNKETLQITLNGTPIDDGVIDIRLFHLSIVTEIIPEGGGTVTADPANPAAGELVTLTVTPAAGYELVSVTGSYLDETQNECSLSITQDEENPNRWSFTMPEGKTYLEVSFKHVYHISIGQSAHGTVTVDKTTAEKGETVTVTPQPADGYTYSGVVYAKTDDPTEFEWAVPDEASGNYTFEMPAYDVTVSLSGITKKSYSLDLVVTPEANHVLSIKDDHAQWGYSVSVSYYSDSGYQVRRIYYKIDGDDTEYALTEDLSGGYSFTMPKANVTIYAAIEAITYPVSVDFGAGHEAFVRDLFEGNDEYSVDGSVVTFRMPAFNRFNEPSTLSDAYNMITDYCNTNVTDPLDNNKRFMYQFGLKARRGYEGEEEFNREQEGYYETPLNKDEPSTLYALWAEPAAATVTVTPPKCGTVLTKDVYHSAGRFNPVPELTVSGNASIRDESFEFTNWLIENADDYQVGATVTLTGENTYSGRLFLNTEWGYFLDSSTAEDAITVVGGTLVSCDTDGKVVISVPVEHSYDEDGICTGCGVQKTAEPEFKSKSLVLSGQIGVNFFMNLPEIEGVDYSNSYMTFAITGKGTTTARDNYDATFKDKSGNGYYGFTCYVSSIQMADTITATFHYGDDQTVSLDYSVADYIAYFDDHQNEYNQTTLDLIKAIADYGHYAQPFLSAENGWTIGTDYAEMTKHYTESFDLDSIKTAIDGYTFVKNIEGSGITKATYRLNLESETMVDVFLTVEDGTELTASATFNGKTFTAVKQADGRYRIRVSGISAHLLGETITITGTAGSDFTITVSALAYARAVLNSEAFGADAKNAMAALYRYYAAVKAYNS